MAMPEEFPPLPVRTRKPTAERPLLGQTLLVVEDSRFASEAVRLMCLHSGARLRRADCLASAHRHLAVYAPTVVLVDLGLPDGSGLDLIAELATAVPRVPVILATSGEDHAEAEAKMAGADDFIAKPIASLAAFQTVILNHLPKEDLPPSPRPMPSAAIAPDPVALRDDLAHVAELLSRPLDEITAAYVAQFLHSLGVTGQDACLLDAAEEMQKGARPDGPALKRVRMMISDRMDATPAF